MGEPVCSKCKCVIRFPDKYKDVFIYPPWECQDCKALLCNYCLWIQPAEDPHCYQCGGGSFKAAVPKA